MRFDGSFPTPAIAVDHLPFAVAGEGWCRLSPDNFVVFGRRCRSSLPGLLGFAMFALIVAIYAMTTPSHGDESSAPDKWLFLAVPLVIAVSGAAFHWFGTSKRTKEWELDWRLIRGYFMVPTEGEVRFHIIVKGQVLYFIPKDATGFARMLDDRLIEHSAPLLAPGGISNTSEAAHTKRAFRGLIWHTSHNGALSYFAAVAGFVLAGGAIALFVESVQSSTDSLPMLVAVGIGICGLWMLKSVATLIFPALNRTLRVVRAHPDEIQSVGIEIVSVRSGIEQYRVTLRIAGHSKPLTLAPRTAMALPQLLKYLAVIAPQATVSNICQE